MAVHGWVDVAGVLLFHKVCRLLLKRNSRHATVLALARLMGGDYVVSVFMPAGTGALSAPNKSKCSGYSVASSLGKDTDLEAT